MMNKIAASLQEGKESLSLWPGLMLEDMGPNNKGCPSITPYLLEGEGPHPVMIVCPGGGYNMRADHEGEPIALWLNRIGVSAVVLNYRVAPYKHPVPLQDAQRAIRIIRNQAAEWNLDKSRVGILGFSAGGHLASTAGTHYDFGDPSAENPIDQESCRPDLQVLCYPVISFGIYAHGGSKHALLGEDPDMDMVQHLSNDTMVTGDTPPAFIWHTAEDAGVPVENSLMFASALSREKIPFELHTFEKGPHGVGLGETLEGAREWPSLCATWLRGRNFIS